MWILIITIFSYGHAPAVTPIYGFTSEDSCKAAGVFYAGKSGTGNTSTTAVCVSK